MGNSTHYHIDAKDSLEVRLANCIKFYNRALELMVPSGLNQSEMNKHRVIRDTLKEALETVNVV